MLVALDNTSTTDAQTSEVSSVTDSAGTTYSKVGEFCNGQGAAGAGATISVWKSIHATGLNGSQSITANLANSVTAKCIMAFRFGTSATNVQLAGSLQTLANCGVDPGSMTVSGLPSKEYLFVRAIAGETNSTTSLTVTSNYGDFSNGQTSGGASNTNMAVRGEYRILTGTSSTSDPTWTAADHASVFFALDEAASGTTASPDVDALTATRFAPTVTASNYQQVTAGLGAATLTAFAPTLKVAILTALGTATLTWFAPTAKATTNTVLTAGVGAVSATGFAPTVAATQNVSVTAGWGRPR